MASQESKRIFQAGKMNRDLDDRLVPSGEYREALNISIGRSEGSDVGSVQNLRGNALKDNGETLEGAVVIGSLRDNTSERIYYFVTTNDTASGRRGDAGEFVHQIWEFEQTTGVFYKLVEYDQREETAPAEDWLNFWTGNLITGVNLLENLLFWTDNRNEPRRIDVDIARTNPGYYDSDNRAAVIKAAPVAAPTFTTTVEDTMNDDVTDSTFLADKLPRFSYRYQYEDGEYSVLAPFTQIAFDPRTQTNGVINPLVLEANRLRRSASTGDFTDLSNKVREVTLQAPAQEGVDFSNTTVEFLYKDTNSNTIYIIGEGEIDNNNPEVRVFTYRSQDPFRAIPASQLTRVYDAVPRLAQAQEIAGGRIVYGNYLQNYDLPDFDFVARVVDADGIDRASVKRRRTYQVGIVFGDRFGRLSPVVLSSSGRDSVFVPADATQNSKQLQVEFTNLAGAPSLFPEWATSYRIVVKQREQEYYNVVFQSGAHAGSDEMYSRSGDNINKIPIDNTAAVEPEAASRPSSAKVYINFDGSEQSQQADLFTPDGIDMMGNVTIDTGGVIADSSPIAFETEPVSSELDIFFETSTGGFVSDIPQNGIVNVEFFNCYTQSCNSGSVAFRLEINRIRAGFNEPFFDVGVRAHLVQENFGGEERRGNTLIHSSGLFNARTNTNQLNQFNEAEGGLTVSLDPSDGTIQKLFAEDTQLLIWQEDKISRSPIDKDFIYSAEGGAVPVTSNSQYLGTIAPYAGEYGISTDPASFAIYGTRKYFTDKNRGVVLRLSNDGLTEVSGSGMNDFFRDALRTSTKIIGSFDEYFDTYNLTIVGNSYAANDDTNIASVRENLVFNSNPDNVTDPSYPREFDYFTISFEEDVKGWNSFKSFKQESGLTLNNTYYTFNGGRLWEHNIENVSRNNFYGVQYDSLVELIFNDSPSAIKDFKTLSTEGSAGWDCVSLITDLETFGEEQEMTTRSILELVPIVNAPLTEPDPQSAAVSFMVTDLNPQEYTFTFDPAAGYEFRDPSQLTLSIGDDAAAQYFTIAAFDDAGERTNPGTTEQVVVDGKLVSTVIFNPPPSLIGADGNMLNTSYDLVVNGDGPTRIVAGVQFNITLGLLTEGVADQAWAQLTGARGNANIQIDTTWYGDPDDPTRPDVTRYVPYGLQGARTFNDDGSLNVLEEVRYFEGGTFSPNGIALESGVDIVYPTTLTDEILTSNGDEPIIVLGNNAMVPTNYSFSNGVPVTRNDLFVFQKFDIPEQRRNYNITSVTSGPNIGRYNRVDVTIVSEPATAQGLLRGPIADDDVRFTREITVSGTPFGTGVDSYTDPTPIQPPNNNTGVVYPGGALSAASGASIDQNGTLGTVKVTMVNENRETFIPVTGSATELPTGWQITNDNVGGSEAADQAFWESEWRYELTDISHETEAESVIATRTFHPEALKQAAINTDVLANIKINGHPEVHVTNVIWNNTLNPGADATVVNNILTLNYGWDGTNSTWDTYNATHSQLHITVQDAPRYYGLFAGRVLDSNVPTGTQTADDNIGVNDFAFDVQANNWINYWQGTGGETPFITQDYAIAPVGGQNSRGRVFRDGNTYDSIDRWTRTPNLTFNPSDHTMVQGTVGYGVAHATEGGTRGHGIWINRALNNGNLAQGGATGIGFRSNASTDSNVEINDILLPYNPYPWQRAAGIHYLKASQTDRAHILGVETTNYSSDATQNQTLAVTQQGVPNSPVPARFNFTGPNSETMNHMDLHLTVSSRYRGVGDDLDTLRWNTNVEAGLPCYRFIPQGERYPHFGQGTRGTDSRGRITGSFLRRNYSEPVRNSDGTTDQRADALFDYMPSLWFGHTLYRGNRISAITPGFTDGIVANRENVTGADALPPNFSTEAGHNLNNAQPSYAQSAGDEDRFGWQAVYDLKQPRVAADAAMQRTGRKLPMPIRMELEIPQTAINNNNIGSMIFGNFAYDTNSGHNKYAPFFFRRLGGNQTNRNQGITYTQGNNEGIPIPGSKIRRWQNGNRGGVIITLEIPVFQSDIQYVHAIEYTNAGGNRAHTVAAASAANFLVGQFNKVATGDTSGDEITVNVGGGVNRELVAYEIRWNDSNIAAAFDAHGGDGLAMRVNYQAQMITNMKLSLINPYWIDTNPSIAVPQGQEAPGDVGLTMNQVWNKDWYYNSHRDYGIPLFYTTPSQTQTPGTHENQHQIVYFVPILGDEGGTRPYSVPGADGMNVDQTRARISTLTNGTMVQRYDPTDRDNPATLLDLDEARQLQLSHGAIEIPGTYTDQNSPIYSMDHLPHLIVFIDEEMMPDTDGDRHYGADGTVAWTSQVELYADCNGRGAQQPGAWMKTMAWDFLDSYWETDGTPKFYPNEWSATNYFSENGTFTGNSAYITLKENADNGSNPNATNHGLAFDTWGLLGHTITRGF